MSSSGGNRTVQYSALCDGSTCGTLTRSMSSNNHKDHTPKDFLKQFISVRLLYFFYGKFVSQFHPHGSEIPKHGIPSTVNVMLRSPKFVDGAKVETRSA